MTQHAAVEDMKDESGLWPSADQLHLLRAALLDGEKAIDAWKQWRASINVDDDFDYGSFRLLPLLYHNMHRLGVEDELMPRLKGVFRMAWYENHRLFHDMKPALEAMTDDGLELFFLKGLPMVHLYYDHHALRPMADIDVLVPVRQVRGAMGFFDRDGWRRNALASDNDLKYRHSMQFTRDPKLELDLHWYVMVECCSDYYNSLFWSRAVDVEVDGLQAKILDPTDFFFHTVVHGIRWNAEPPIRWIPDAMMILRKEHNAIDWDRLVGEALAHGFSHRLGLGIAYLKKHFDADIPDNVLSRLQAQEVSLTEKIENSFVLRNTDELFNTIWGKVWVIFAEYQRLAPKRTHFPHVIGFSKYLRHRLHLNSRRDFVPEFFAGSYRRLRGSIARKA